MQIKFFYNTLVVMLFFLFLQNMALAVDSITISDISLKNLMSNYVDVSYRVSGIDSAQAQPKIEYGLTTAYGSNNPWGSINKISDTVFDFSGPLRNLQSDTLYNYRAVVTVNGYNYTSSNYTFRTLKSGETSITISTPSVTNLSAVGAKITYSVIGREFSNPSLCYSTSQANILSNCMSLIVSNQQGANFETGTTLIGLIPQTKYYYQLVLDKDTAIEIKDQVYSFETLSDITISNISLKNLMSNYVDVSYRVSGIDSAQAQPKIEYGLTTAYGSNNPWGSINKVSATVFDFSGPLRNLQPDTLYNYRAVVVVRFNGHDYTSDNYAYYTSDNYAFRTLKSGGTGVTISAPSVTNLSAVGAKITYSVIGREFSNPSLCYSTSQANILSNCMSLIVSNQQGANFETGTTLIGLPPQTKYYYQLVLDKDTAIEIKDQVYSFTTLSDSAIISPQPSTTLSEIEKKYQERIRQFEYRISELEQKVIEQEKQLATAVDLILVSRVQGRILLQVEENGEAWYVDPVIKKKFYLKDGQSAYLALNAFGLGITNADIAKIPIGIEARFDDTDTDNDGLADKLEEAIGSNPASQDSDGDGYEDKTEVLNGYNPAGRDKFVYNNQLINRLKGRIILQVESQGQAWYINPVDGKRYYMKDGDQAYQIMRFLSLGITNQDLHKIPVGELSE